MRAGELLFDRIAKHLQGCSDAAIRIWNSRLKVKAGRDFPMNVAPAVLDQFFLK